MRVLYKASIWPFSGSLTGYNPPYETHSTMDALTYI